ncbi:cob(I)yrinic acid a,c-diamide adenosyltransferase [Desulfobacca acetoxidans]|nr:cob(I)yrinic acid a,c-diamide adenosyltransferase [Desulfobacca acetoxidans]HAY21407.1 cob(I)yrinic acid a,c-diamide adenosyltransferase [Desulfobacterales bacterium]
MISWYKKPCWEHEAARHNCSKEGMILVGKLEQGLVQIYTGEGKGKTTAALGLALRALGRGLKVFMLQFLKGDDTGELFSTQQFGDKFVIRQTGLGGFIRKGKAGPEDAQRAKEAMNLAKDILRRGDYDLVILDEINVALYFELVSVPEVLKLLQARAPHVEVVLTGRYAPQEIIEAADLVTEMKNIKHYYHAGVKARKGIES